jgi:hypothetical protein
VSDQHELSRDGSRGAVVYRVAGGQDWRIRVARYPEYSSEGTSGWFGGKVLWGHDKETYGAALQVALDWVRDGKLPEGIAP